MSTKVIIPYNFTANDEKSIDFVISRYHGVKDVELTLYHAYHPVPEISPLNNPIMEKMNRTTSYLRQQLNDQKTKLEDVRYRLSAAGFRSENIKILFTALKEDFSTDLICLIQKEQYDTVVLNRNPGNIINYFTRSVSKRVSQVLNTSVGIHIVN